MIDCWRSGSAGPFARRMGNPGMQETNTVVALARCNDYESARVRAAVQEALGLVPGIDELVASRGRVLLKPNLLSSNDPPERAVNTHPELVRAVAEFFVERGWRVFIGDSCGNLSPGSTGRAIRVTGLDRVAAEVGARLVDFDRAPCVEVEVPTCRVLRRVRIPRLIHEVDLFVTLPKLKTHGLTLLTGAVKNQFGLTPGRGKKEIHMAAPRPSALADAVLDIYTVARPHLAIMDAVVGMEGNGPAAGPPRKMGLILAGCDCVALDAVAARIMGFGCDEVDTIRLGRERGLGEARWEKIKVLGMPLEDAMALDFKRPTGPARSMLMNLIPAPLLRWMFHLAGTSHAVVAHDRCVLCGDCIANCPAGALRELNGRIETDRRLCIACYCCAEVCKQRAISMQRPLAGRLLHGLRQLLRRP